MIVNNEGISKHKEKQDMKVEKQYKIYKLDKRQAADLD